MLKYLTLNLEQKFWIVLKKEGYISDYKILNDSKNKGIINS